MSYPRDAIVITGLGMVSALGPDVVTSCAAARAGISRPSELTVLAFSQYKKYGEAPVVGHVARFIGEGFAGTGKLFALGLPALRDVIARAALADHDQGRLGLMVNFSDQFYEKALEAETATEQARPSGLHANGEVERLGGLMARLVSQCGLPVVRRNQKVYVGGHAGFIHVLHDAIQAITSGMLDQCLVGGIDSCVEPRTLEAGAAAGVLKTADNPVGYMPGEAAAFCLVERLDRAQARRAPIDAVIESPVSARDPHHRLAEEPPLGQGLSKAVAASLNDLDLQACPIGLIIGDLNGDPYRATEWGYTLVRTVQPFALGEVPMWIPAVSFGDVGAATGAVAMCIALRGFARGYAHADRALVWLSSDAGLKSAFCLRRFQS